MEMRLKLVSFIENHKARIAPRHYVVEAYTDTMWFYFFQFRVGTFIEEHGHDFCLVIHGSPTFDHAFILPFRDFKDFFSADLLDGNQRWVCNIPANHEVIKLSLFGKSKERPVREYHNAFHLLQDAPAFDRAKPDIGTLI